MLKVFQALGAISFGKLMYVYSESNTQNARILFPGEEPNIALLRVEQDFYQYLKEVFFSSYGAFCAVWEQGTAYTSALRMEPYRDGLLLAGLETPREYRRQGYASSLIKAVAEMLRQQGTHCVYSHVDKRNLVSLKVHQSCGFERISEHAVFIDGSVSRDFCTLSLQL